MSGASSNESTPDQKPAAVEDPGAAAMMIEPREEGRPSPLGEDAPAYEAAATAVAEAAAAASKSKGKAPRSKKKSNRIKKPKDMPRRPLSAYNIFFREERERMLKEHMEAAKAARGNDDNDEPLPGPKIGFENMAKTIGKRWKALSEEELARYKELAKEDMERYKVERDSYQ